MNKSNIKIYDKIDKLEVRLLSPPSSKSTIKMKDREGTEFRTYSYCNSLKERLGYRYLMKNKNLLYIKDNLNNKFNLPDIWIHVSGIVNYARTNHNYDYTGLTNCKFQLPENYILKNIDILILHDSILRYQRLSSSVLNKAIEKNVCYSEDGFKRKLNIHYISKYQKLSEEFILEHLDILYLKYLKKSHLKQSFQNKIKMLIELKK